MKTLNITYELEKQILVLVVAAVCAFSALSVPATWELYIVWLANVVCWGAINICQIIKMNNYENKYFNLNKSGSLLNIPQTKAGMCNIFADVVALTLATSFMMSGSVRTESLISIISAFLMSYLCLFVNKIQNDEVW